MRIVKSVSAGHVKIVVKEFGDGRFGFDVREDGKRKMLRWRSEEDALAEARRRVKATNAGRVDLLSVTPAEWELFEEWRQLGIDRSVFEEFRAWKDARSKSKTVNEVFGDLLAIKKEDTDLDPVYVGNLEGPWKLFCETFGKHSIAEVEPSEIESWLRDLKKTPRTRNNIRDVIVQLFRFAREREYLPDAITAAEKVKRLKIKTRANDIEIWSPAEMRLLIEHAKPDFLPWVLFGGFAGIRTNEIRPRPGSRKDCLRWEDVHWGEKQVYIRAEVAKTGRSRYVPMADSLLAWLKSHRDKTGPVIKQEIHEIYDDIERMERDIRASAEKLGGEEAEQVAAFKFKKNALRHSYGSYRNAIIRNISQLADEMGNSPGIARKNYERPQPRSLADEWFAIEPANS